MQMLENLIRKNRSCRRFYQNNVVNIQTLEGLVNLARLSASAGNLQPLTYILSCNPKKNEEIFSCLTWAAYLKDWAGPEEGERPAAYVVVMLDSTISKDPGCDHGIACQSIMLGAREKGLASCMIGAIDREKLKQVLNVANQHKILLVLAIGKPKETVVIEPVLDPDKSIKYWRDEKGMHHVPKRSLQDIIVKSYN
jgi:nitroreductase